MLLLIVLLCAGLSLAANKEFETYIIACHTSDFECFKQQYKALRDHVFLGNDKLVIDIYESFKFKYGDSGTCIKLAGVNESNLVAISFNSIKKEYKITLKMPLKIQQVRDTETANVTKCAEIDHKFESINPASERLYSFTGNVTVQVTYPYHFLKKKYTYLSLEEEKIDLILDIPDLSHYKDKPGEQGRLYMLSEWAYDVTKHINVAELVFLPYTARIRTALGRIPLEKLLLLYPEEQYTSLNVNFSEAEE